MRLILNVDAIAPPLTGIGRYALELAQGLAGHDEIDAIRYYSAYRWVATPDEALQRGGSLAIMRKHVPGKRTAMRTYFWARQKLFSRQTRSRCSDWLLHTPNYILFRHGGPSVATLHDFSWMHYPEHHPRERIDIMQREMPKTYEQATRFITDSEFVRQEAIDLVGLDPERIDVVPLGVDAAYQPMPAADTLDVLQRYALVHGEYLLAVATIEPRKNLERLLRAFAALPPATRKRYPLVLIGVRGWHVEGIERLAAPLVESGEVLRLGYVPEFDLPALYAGARAFAFVSLHEGFGLPPLEAMASGVPVLASDTTSLPEVIGDAGHLVDPLDVDAIRDGLEHVLLDDDWRASAIERGLQRAALFTWQACVDQTVAVYRRALAA